MLPPSGMSQSYSSIFIANGKDSRAEENVEEEKISVTAAAAAAAAMAVLVNMVAIDDNQLCVNT